MTAETDAEESTRSSLVRGIETDRPEDTRSCPHACHGELTLDADDRVLCEVCRCTPDGVFLPPEREDGGDGVNGSESQCSQYLFFRGRSGGDGAFYPHPWADTERARYRHSGHVRLVGGFERPWPQEKLSRDGSLI